MPLTITNTAGGPQTAQPRGWMASSGGVTRQPTGNYTMSGGANGGGYTGSVGGVDPVRVGTPQPDFGNWQRFADEAYGQNTRMLDPQWKQQEDAFRQQMVGRGLAEGTEAYNTAWDNFSRSKNDAYDQARSSSMQQGLGAQNQAWNQNYQQAQLANALAQSRYSADASVLGANIGAGASMYGHDVGRLNFSDQLGFNRERADMQDLMGLFGAGNDMTAYNNGQLGADYGRGGDFMSLIPGLNPSGLNVQGALGQANQAQYQNSQNQYQADQAQQNQNMQMASMLAMMFASSRALKTSEGELSAADALTAILGLQVDRWRYHGDDQIHVGPYAEDFNVAITGTPKPTISVIDMLGTIVKAIQAIAGERAHAE